MLLYNAASLPTCSVVGASRLRLVVVASVVLVDVSRAALAQAETVVRRSVTANRNERMTGLSVDSGSHLDP